MCTGQRGELGVDRGCPPGRLFNSRGSGGSVLELFSLHGPSQTCHLITAAEEGPSRRLHLASTDGRDAAGPRGAREGAVAGPAHAAVDDWHADGKKEAR